jgi:hypothetical protein
MKKKLFILSMLLGVFTFCSAQSLGDLAKAAASTTSKQATSTATKSFDVAGISSQVMGLLSPKLNLSSAQKPLVSLLVNELLNKKKNILTTALSNKAGYAAQMTGLRNLFPSKMKGILNAAQYASKMLF